jgi:hypothetical protein
MAQYHFQEKEKQVVPRTAMEHRGIIRAEQYWGERVKRQNVTSAYFSHRSAKSM